MHNRRCAFPGVEVLETRFGLSPSIQDYSQTYRRTLANLSGLSCKALLRTPSECSPTLLIPRDAKATCEDPMKCRSEQHVSHMALCSNVLLAIVPALPSAPSCEPAHHHARYCCQRTRPYREQQETPSPRTSRPPQCSNAFEALPIA